MSTRKCTTYTAADFETIEPQNPAPCETWLAAINNKWTSAYTWTPEGGDAIAARERAFRHYVKDEPAALPVVAMTWEQVGMWERKRNAESPAAQPHAITEDDYYEMLNVLPPMHWNVGGPFEHFKMGEFTTGSWTNQYGCVRGMYACKMVDVTDDSTWLTAEEVQAANANQEATQ